MLSEEHLIQNYEKYKSFLLKTGDHRKQNLTSLVDYFGNRLILCPASSKKQHNAAYPGGFIDHSLRVLKNAMRLVKVAPDIYGDIPEESIIFASLCHNLGKIGNLDYERYLVQDNEYYRKKGNVYELNVDICTIRDASLFILQHFGVQMSYPEWESVNHDYESRTRDNEMYHLNQTFLTQLIIQSDCISSSQEKLLENTQSST